MEESADFALNKNKFSLINNDQLNSIDVSNNDPIPSLFIPKNNITQEKNSIITQIIKDVTSNKKNTNLNQIKQKIQNKISIIIPLQNLQKHNSSPNEKNIMLINDLIESKETHFIATFKDYLISDFHEEFLRRYFHFNETKDILPKFYQYYKNYLNFFCKGTFSDFYLNEMMQEYGECQAEFYYNRNYGHKERMKKKEKKGLDDINNNNEESYESENMSNYGNIKSIFSKSIKYSIDMIQKFGNNNNENKKELSNIKPSNYSKDNSISLPDDSSVSYNDIITNQNSLRYIINIINNKKQNSKKIKNKKREIIYNKNKNNNNNGDYINYIISNNFKKIINNNAKNIVNKKDTQTLSKTNSNVNIVNMKNKNKTRTKSYNTKSNPLNNNNMNYKIKNNQSVSNYKKYIDFLTNKQRNKSNDPKIKISQDEFTFSLQKINQNIKGRNIISPLSPNGIMSHFNFFSTNNFSCTKKEDKYKGNNINTNLNSNNTNKVNSLFLINNIFNKTNRNSNKYSTIFPLSVSKNNISKHKYNNKEQKVEYKEKKKSKNKDRIMNMNNNPNNKFFFHPNISIKSVKNLSPPPKNPNIINNNNNNFNTNNVNSSKQLSYSTVNNCNININNNIILSNNYYNSKNHHPMNSQQHQINSLKKKKADKKSKQKNNFSNKSLTKYASISRNSNKNDLNRFKTEVNILNLLSQEKDKTNKNINNNIQYKSFRKSNNQEISSKIKKYNNNTHNRNLSLKNMPVTIKSNLNSNFSMNKTGKILDEYDLNITSKTYRHFCLRKNNNGIHQNKIIFDYKRK